MPNAPFPREDAWTPRRPRLALALVAVAGVGLSVAAVEAVLRVTAPVVERVPESDRALRLRELPPGLDIDLWPPAEALANADALADRPVRLQTDGEGFILPSRRHEAPDRAVLFLGGSTTACYFVPDSLRFHALAGAMLDARTGLRVNTLNAARTGNHSVHSLVRLIGTLAPLEPDVAVLMHNVNDLTTLLREGDYWNENPSRGLLARPGCKRPGCHLRRGLAKATQHLVPALSARWAARGGPEREFDAPALPPDSARIAERFRRSLVTFVETARTWGITPVLMTQANRFTPAPQPTLGWSPDDVGVSYAEYRALYVAFNDIIRSVAAAYEVPLVDLAARVPSDRSYLYDYVHLTDAGSRLVAAEVVDVLSALPSFE